MMCTVCFLGLALVFFLHAAELYDAGYHWNSSTAVIDTFTTAIFFSGMWLMARRKIENWIFWIVGDIISIPLYLIKGFSLTSIQYLIFTFIAIYGYLEWKKIINKYPATVKR